MKCRGWKGHFSGNKQGDRSSKIQDSVSFSGLCVFSQIERLGESCATHNSQSASRSGVEAHLARNLNGRDESDARLSEG